MAYKVLNSVSLKDTSSMRIANLNTSMLVILIQKKIECLKKLMAFLMAIFLKQ